MPAILDIGCEVSSHQSKLAPLMPLQPGAKKRKRERMSGIILKSAPGGKWVVLWATGEQESCSPRVLKFEDAPSAETMMIVRSEGASPNMRTLELQSEASTENQTEGNNTAVITESTECTAIVPVATQPSESTALVPVPETEETAMVLVNQDEDESQEQTEEDDMPPVGSGYVYEDGVLNEVLSDRFGARRREIEQLKEQLVGQTVNVSGREWVVIHDIEEEDIEYTDEEFAETGLRSENYLDLNCLPKRHCTRGECEAGRRASPRVSRDELKNRDEGKAMLSYFQSLYPVPWKQSLKYLNTSIENHNASLLNRQRKTPLVSEYEYWNFIGLILLAAIQKTGGMDGVFQRKEEYGVVTRVPVDKYMTYSRFKGIKDHWVEQFHDDAHRETDQWWKVKKLVDGFNKNRSQVVGSSRVKVLDESMSAFKPQTSKTGNLPHLSFILRKPEPLGTELKTVASKASNGPIIHAEIQEGKMPMRAKTYSAEFGPTAACTLRLVEGTKDSGQKPDPMTKNLYYGDSWFAGFKTAVAIKEKFDCEFVGPIKNSHKFFPRKYLEDTMETWPPGSHLVLRTTKDAHKYYGIGYKYNSKKVLVFIATENAGHTQPGTPYEAKWQDANGRIAKRSIARPSILAEYFAHSNMIDKHNHARQFELAIEKHMITQDGYMRLFCTYLGITITDAWKLYRDRLGPKHKHKGITLMNFTNIVTKHLLLNDYNKYSYESAPLPTLPLLNQPSSRQALSFPQEVQVQSPNPPVSTLGSGTGNLISLGNGKFISSTFKAKHDLALCEQVDMFVHCKHAFAGRRRVRGRCRTCKKQTNSKCTACNQWFCNPSNVTNRFCFETHKAASITEERLQYYEDTNK